MKSFVTCLLLLSTLYPVTATCRPIETKPSLKGVENRSLTPDNETLKTWMYEAGLRHNVKPEYVIAVGNIESRKGQKEFRCFEIGRKPYYGPMGLCIPILDVEANIDRGAKALARFGPVQNLGQLKEVLQVYNAEFNGPYWSEIKKAVSRYEYWVYQHENKTKISSLKSESDTQK